ncbi:hypothetical protein [Nitrosomonas sp. Nm34]|uniref:hypothetical protein n=1 Tax=Nitrosomonas sp. Nm34 TaxID=1881055 RepID=UPI0008F227B8|nr:hypothetical protein [Nitrosomonas sp. Nm34]SFI82356.1 hypothetical protein SAMN05428978_104117 [Nitrosomonas sp. Nm34]
MKSTWKRKLLQLLEILAFSILGISVVLICLNTKEPLASAIGFATVYIAYQQWRTNQQKLNFDRYDRRLKVYDEVRKILSLIIQKGTANYEDLRKFYSATSEAYFLFGNEIQDYIDEIFRRGINLERWSTEYKDSFTYKKPGHDYDMVSNRMHEDLVWFSEQLEPAKEKFKKYLHIR